jgi:hypothetical protein
MMTRNRSISNGKLQAHISCVFRRTRGCVRYDGTFDVRDVVGTFTGPDTCATYQDPDDSRGSRRRSGSVHHDGTYGTRNNVGVHDLIRSLDSTRRQVFPIDNRYESGVLPRRIAGYDAPDNHVLPGLPEWQKNAQRGSTTPLLGPEILNVPTGLGLCSCTCMYVAGAVILHLALRAATCLDRIDSVCSSSSSHPGMYESRTYSKL